MLRWAELKKIFIDVEVVLNKRPLGYMENDHQLPTLTPNSMLFIGTTFALELEAYHVEEKDLRKRAKYLMKCKESVWRKWSSEYLRRLRQSHNLKHKKLSYEMKKGDVVIVESEEHNRGKWPIGIVEELFKRRDGTFVR